MEKKYTVNIFLDKFVKHLKYPKIALERVIFGKSYYKAGFIITVQYFLEPGGIATITHCCVAHLCDLFDIEQCTN